MKKRMIFLAGAALALVAATSVLAQSDSSHLHESMPNPPAHPTGTAHTNDPAATPERRAGQGLIPGDKGTTGLSDQDKQFVTQALQYAKTQIAAGELALKISHQPKVITYAKQAVSTGNSSVAPLERIAKANGVSISAADAKATDEVQKLKAAQGTVFEGLYGQLEHDNQVQILALYADEADKGSNAELKSFAGAGKQHASVMLKSAEQLNEGTIDRTDPRCKTNPGAAGCP